MTRKCPHCAESQYIKDARWICSDHAGCGATATPSLDDLRDAVDDFETRIERLHHVQRMAGGTPTPTRLARIEALQRQRAVVVATLREELEIHIDQLTADLQHIHDTYYKAPRSFLEDATRDVHMELDSAHRELTSLT